MATLRENLTQPAQGGVVRAHFAGDPTLVLDELVLFIPYGIYKVVSVVSTSPIFSSYDLLLLFRWYSTAPEVIPSGVASVLEGEGVTHSVLPYSAVIALSFKEADYRTLTLTGNITFNAQHHNAGKSVVVKIRNSSGTLSRNLTFPPSWIFIGPSGRPSSIAPSRTGILSITCFGTSDADVIAAYAVQA